MRKTRWPLIAFAGAAILLCFCLPKPEPAERDPSVIAVINDPEMYRLEPPETLSLTVKGVDLTITKKAEYALRGIPVGVKRYSGGWRGKLSPCDVAAVWGNMTIREKYKQLKWKQHGRWYYWRYDDDFGFDNAYVSRYSSNNHMIPATENLRRALRRMKPGVPFEASGYLVNITGRRGEDQYWWFSSESFNDTGDGSCEVLYVTSLKYGGCVYR